MEHVDPVCLASILRSSFRLVRGTAAGLCPRVSQGFGAPVQESVRWLFDDFSSELRLALATQPIARVPRCVW